VRIRDRLGISSRLQRRLTWLMEAVLLGTLLAGIVRTDTGIIVNSAIALLVTRLPSILERDYGVADGRGAGAVDHRGGVLPRARHPHAARDRALGLPVGLVVGSLHARTLLGRRGRRLRGSPRDRYPLPERPPPLQFMFVFLLAFVLAAGVFWEVVEFALAELSAIIGTDRVLTQYGLEDTILDLVFDVVGAVLVAVRGTAHLTDVVGALAARLDGKLERSE
jgi:hypothetical protein